MVPRTAGIFPLGFGGQDIGPSLGQVIRLLLVQALQKDLNIVPAEMFHRPVRIARPIRGRGAQAGVVVGHHRLVLGLGELVLAEVKALGMGDLGLGIIRAIPLRWSDCPW